MDFIATYLLAHIIFNMSLMRGGLPDDIKLMVLLERPYEDIDQAMGLISAVYRIDGHRFTVN